jgi:hypothetical protein
VILEATLWPLGIGIWLGVLLLLAAFAVFIVLLVLALPFAAAVGFKRGIDRYRQEKAQRLESDSTSLRTRSE